MPLIRLLRPILHAGASSRPTAYDNLPTKVADHLRRHCKTPYIDRKSRHHDQMVQAERSGNKNIAEGSQVSGTSKESELKLVNVARGSLEELLGDYQDYLRQRGHALWDKNSKEALYVRKLGKKPELSYEDFCTFIETRPPEVVANILICLIHQANYLLDQQLRRSEQDFLREGGLRERMTRARLAARSRQRPPRENPATIRRLSPLRPRQPAFPETALAGQLACAHSAGRRRREQTTRFSFGQSARKLDLGSPEGCRREGQIGRYSKRWRQQLPPKPGQICAHTQPECFRPPLRRDWPRVHFGQTSRRIGRR